MNLKVICIDSGNKPAKIPDNEWIIKDNLYTVTKVVKMGIQPGVFGYLLKEVSLSEKSFPYEFYSSNRFAIVTDQTLKNTTEEITEIEELTV